MTELENNFILLFNAGYLEDSISKQLDLVPREYEYMYNRLLEYLSR